MKLKFISPYKSVIHLLDIELPDFVILTGVNGAGKTHLIEAIERGSIQIDDINLNPLTRPIRLFNWSNLVPNDSAAFASYQITQERQSLWNEISQQIKSIRDQIFNVLRQYNRFDLLPRSPSELIQMTVDELMRSNGIIEEAIQLHRDIQNIVQNESQYFTGNFVRNDINRRRLIESLQKNNTPLLTFEEEDFYKYFPRNWMPVDIFQQSFSRLFMEYQFNLLNNRLKKMANSEGKTVEYLSDLEFVEQYGEPPWVFVNSVLKTANLEFRINQPAEYYEDRPYRVGGPFM